MASLPPPNDRVREVPEGPSTPFQRFLASLEDTAELISESDEYLKAKHIASRVAAHSGTALNLLGNIAWVAATAAIVLVVPLVFEVEREMAALPAPDAAGGAAPPAAPPA